LKEKNAASKGDLRERGSDMGKEEKRNSGAAPPHDFERLPKKGTVGKVCGKCNIEPKRGKEEFAEKTKKCGIAGQRNAWFPEENSLGLSHIEKAC